MDSSDDGSDVITARLASDSDRAAALAAYDLASMRCDPDHDPHPPRGLVVDHPWVFVAWDEDVVVGTAVVRHNDDEVMWLTILGDDAAGTWAALGDIIIAETGMRPWGRVRNPALRSRLQHPELRPDPDDEEVLRWR